MSLVPLNYGLFQFRDPNTDQPVRNGFVYAPDPVTGNPAEIYGDQNGTVVFADGIVPLNSNGEAFLFGSQIYTLEVRDSCQRLILTYSPVGFSPILTPGIVAITIPGGGTTQLLPENTVNGRLYDFCTLFVSVDDGGVKNDATIEVPAELNDILVNGAVIDIVRVNSAGGTFGQSGFTIVAAPGVKLPVPAGYLNSCGVVDSLNNSCRLTKYDDNSYWLNGQLDV